jgi:hypothetical protein
MVTNVGEPHRPAPHFLRQMEVESEGKINIHIIFILQWNGLGKYCLPFHE